MARDCPDRQRGTDWRNNGGYGGRGPQRAIGGGDAVDREMEVSHINPCFLKSTLLTEIATYARAFRRWLWPQRRSSSPY